MFSDLLAPIFSLSDALEQDRTMPLPTLWRTAHPALFAAVEPVLQSCRLEHLEYELIPGGERDRRRRQSFRATWAGEACRTAYDTAIAALQEQGVLLHQGESSFLALQAGCSLACELRENGLMIDVYRQPSDISVESIREGMAMLPLTRMISGLLPMLRLREFVCERRTSGPLCVKFRAYRTMEHLGKDEEWLWARGFVPDAQEPTLLAHTGEEGTTWLFWQGEDVACFAGEPPAYVLEREQI